jgi:hypothetical protein
MYNYQCMCGHFGSIPRGSDLEKRAKKREAAGFLDAIILSLDDCPDCKHEKECEERLYGDSPEF